MEVADPYSGLFGPIIITRADAAAPETAAPTDVDRELVLTFQVRECRAKKRRLMIFRAWGVKV